MARKRKAPSLAQAPWETETPSGAKLARRGLVRGAVLTEARLDDSEREAKAVTGSEAVWRTATSSLMKGRDQGQHAALLAYAETCEAIHASGGAFADGASGVSTTPTGPSLSQIAAVERLRHMHQALSKGALVVPLSNARCIRRGPREARLPYRQLVDWVALDHLGLADILARIGASAKNEAARADLRQAVACAADLLAPFALMRR